MVDNLVVRRVGELEDGLAAMMVGRLDVLQVVMLAEMRVARRVARRVGEMVGRKVEKRVGRTADLKVVY